MSLDRTRLKRYSIEDRPSKVDDSLSGAPVAAGASFAEFLQSLPNILQARTLLDLIDAMAAAIRAGKPVLVLYGAHLVKTGLTPIICQALKEGWITFAASNGAGSIHDLELARFGQTSEDVAEALEDGSFGMAIETGTEWNQAVTAGRDRGLGLGDAIGAWIAEKNSRGGGGDSIMETAHRLGRPVTVHVAIGTDITHAHPEADGAAIGATTFRDFETLCERVCGLNEGGVVLNIGSAVILPEVFLKALGVARNLAGPVQSFTAANLDMNRHYRPTQNVLLRPTRNSGKALEVIGPHEILVPILFRGICEKLAGGGR